MTYDQLLEKIEQYVSMKKRKNKIAKFARRWGVAFVLFGSLLAAYGITTFPSFFSFFYSEPLPSEKLVPVIGTVWNYITNLFKGIPVSFILIAVALLSCFLSSVTTLLYACLCKEHKFEITKRDENLENAAFLKKYDFDLYVRLGNDANSNVLSNILFLLCALALFIYIGYQIHIKYIICGIFCAFLFYFLFLFIRSFYVLCVKGLWKEDVILKTEIENGFDSIIKKLEKEKAKLEAEVKHKQQIEEEERKRKKQQEETQQKQEKIVKDMLDGQKLYEEAIASEPINKELMKQAAKLGSVSACYYFGKNLLSDWMSDMYTAEEKEEIAEDAAKYFDVARQVSALADLDVKTECQFLWLFSRLQYESNTKSQWQQMLNDLRDVQKAGDLPEEYIGTLEFAIKSVVNNIDRLDEQPTPQPTYNTEPTKTLYCKFRNGAICTKDSGSTIIYHCRHVNDPGACLTARDNHGLEWH